MMSAHSTRVAKVSCAAIAGTLRRQPSSQWFGVRSQSQKAVASSPSTCVESWSTTYTLLAQPHYIDMRNFGHELHEVYDALLKVYDHRFGRLRSPGRGRRD